MRRSFMSDEPRISPVDADTAEGALKEIVDGNRSKWGKSLLPYLLYARSPALFKGTMAMWAAVWSFEKIDAQLKALVNRRVAWWNGCQF
jgi:alkylhydroperoxidase family enzyme